MISQYLLFGRGTNVWRSVDGGASFQQVFLTYGQDQLYLRYVTLHPTRSSVLLASHVDAHCLDGSISPNDPLCSYEAKLIFNRSQKNNKNKTEKQKHKK